MTDYNEHKAEQISQEISALLDHSRATMGEGCAAMAVAMRAWLDLEPDPMRQAFLTMHVVKSLVGAKSVVQIIRPNGN